MSTSTYSFDHLRQHTTVVNTAKGFVFSGSVLNRHAKPANQVWANCEASLVNSQPTTIFSFVEQQGWAPMFVGGVAVNGVSARRFKFTDGGMFSPQVDYYDDAVTRTPLRVGVSVGGVQRMFIDVLNFTAITSFEPVQWPGPVPDEASNTWGAACPAAVVVPAGAALYPGAPPLGFTTSLLPSPALPVSISSDSSSAYIRDSSSTGRRLLGGSSASPSPPLPPAPPPSPPRPPPPPCNNNNTQTWRICYADSRGCTTVSLEICYNITTFYSNYVNATVQGRRLLQTDAPFFLGRMAVQYDGYQQKATALITDPVPVDLSFAFWPAEAKSLCMSYQKNLSCTSTACQTAFCEILASKLGSNGTVALTPTAGTLSLKSGKSEDANGKKTDKMRNSTFIGLSGGESMVILPPQPGFPFDSSQFPVASCIGKDICFVARVWWFVDGSYKQVCVPGRNSAPVCLTRLPPSSLELTPCALSEHVYLHSRHRADALHGHRQSMRQCSFL